MQIIQTYSLAEAINLVGREEICDEITTLPAGIATTDLVDIEEALFPVLHPRLLYKYQGIQTHPETGVTLALIKDDDYYVWNETELAWQISPTPVYYELAILRPLLPAWTGAIQIKAKFTPGLPFKTLEIGYEVNIDLEDWILQFGLPEKLGIDLKLSCVTLCNDGQRLNIPSLIDPAAMENIEVQPFDGQCIPGTLDDCCQFINLSESITPGGVQLHFTIKPPIEYIDRNHQIGAAPAITIEKMPSENRHAPVRDNWIYGSDGTLFGDVLNYNYDLCVEITVIGNKEAHSRSIVHQLISHLEDQAFLEATPFALEFGLKQEDLPTENPITDQETELNSTSFKLRIYHLPASF